MLPSSHEFPIKGFGAECLPSPQLLADAFSEFISASTLLEASYRELQQQVSRLDTELSRQNAALTRTLSENERMRETLQQMLDSMPCGVLVVKDNAEIAMINPEGRRLLEIKDQGMSDLGQLSRVSGVNFESLTKGPTAEVDCELSIRSDCGVRWLAIGNRRLSCARSHENVVHKTPQLESIWILRDNTPMKLAEQEREAARRATVLAEISTILAHEIRNPLASMELFAGLIEQDGNNLPEWISNLRAGIRTLSGIVNNVLSFHGESRPRLVAIDLPTCVRGGVEFVRPISEQAGVALSFSYNGEGLLVNANEDAIHQIILNIVCNAVRHTPAGGQITVTTQKRESLALLEISDSGCGIPADVIGQIFDTGFSMDGENHGLGLAVCKRLMDQHRGQIHVSSQAGEGTTFCMEFPIL